MIIKKQKGSFLLEFLVALGIFSIALIGLVKLQSKSMSNLSDIGSDMAVPILIADFTDRINLSNTGSLSDTDKNELQATANALMKDISESAGATIVIKDLHNQGKTAIKYTVELDDSRKEWEE